MILTTIQILTPAIGALTALTVVTEARRVTVAVLDGYALTLEQARNDAAAAAAESRGTGKAGGTSRLPSLDRAAEMIAGAA